MTKVKAVERARAGDILVVDGHRVGDAKRTGKILEVLPADGSEHYRVLWEDGHESIVYPSSDATVKPGR